MVRTHVQLTEDQTKALRQLSAATGRSVPELIRRAVELYLGQVSREERIQRAIRIAGKFSSGAAKAGVNHDRYLADAFKG